jgi:L,D-transpeptidase YcbB
MSISRTLVLFILLLDSCDLQQKKGNKQPETGFVSLPDIPERATPDPDSAGLLRHADELLLKRFWTKEADRFYERRKYRPAWSESGVPNDASVHLFTAIGEAPYHGLRPKDYHYRQIGFMISEMMEAGKKEKSLPLSVYAHFDLLLTHSYLKYASDLLTGKVNPNNLEIIWEAHPRSKDLARHLQNALSDNRVQSSLHELEPSYDQYRLIKDQLKSFLDLKHSGKWQSPGPLPVLHKNDTGRYVMAVREFLVITGDHSSVNNGEEDAPVYNDILETAVKRFQKRHGLEVDGIVGENTAAAMNRSLEWRIGRLSMNMERFRWLPEKMGDSYLTVNLPEYFLRYYQDGSLEEEMRVIIGTEENLTPILIDTLAYIEFNPTWTIPFSIATGEMLPELREDPDYLKKRNINILDAASRKRIENGNIDWEKYDTLNFPFIFVQEPGPWNALGQLKFIFPNRLAIYLHDTPSDELFNSDTRTFSHGCIRVERPVDLAKSLLDRFNGIPGDSVEAILSDTIPHKVYLEGTVPVYFTYQTAWVDRMGYLNFRDDVYTVDREQSEMADEYHLPEGFR